VVSVSGSTHVRDELLPGSGLGTRLDPPSRSPLSEDAATTTQCIASVATEMRATDDVKDGPGVLRRRRARAIPARPGGAAEAARPDATNADAGICECAPPSAIANELFC